MSESKPVDMDSTIDAQLRGRFLRPAVAVLAFAFLAVAGVVWLAAERQNRLAGAQTAQVVASLARRQVTDIERLTLDYAWWDASVQNLVLQVDPVWADDNIGQYLKDMMGVSLTIVLDPDNHFVYGAVDGRRVEALPGEYNIDVLLAGIAAARRADPRAPRATGGFIKMASKTFAIAIAPVTPETSSSLAVAKPGTVLVLGRWINEDELASLARDFQITDLSLETVPEPEEGNLPLVDFSSQTVTHLTWSQPRPGGRWIEVAIPGLTLIFLLMVAFGWRVYSVWREALARLTAKEVSVRAAKDEAEASNRVKTAFLANVSHELRTPLNAIIGFSSIMSDQMLGPIGSPKYLGYAKDIHGTSRHLMAIINEILDLSTIESTRNVLNVSTFQVSDAIAEAIRLAGAEHQKIRFSDSAATDANRLLRADRGKLIQILTNLLTNAAKASPEGGEVRLVREVTPDRAYRIRVIDDGPGIDEATARILFTPFARGASPYSSAAGGYGIGLAVSKRLAELHGAELTLRSTPDSAGSTAELILPPERVMVSTAAASVG